MCALVTGVQTCALPISPRSSLPDGPKATDRPPLPTAGPVSVPPAPTVPGRAPVREARGPHGTCRPTGRSWERLANWRSVRTSRQASSDVPDLPTLGKDGGSPPLNRGRDLPISRIVGGAGHRATSSETGPADSGGQGLLNTYRF